MSENAPPPPPGGNPPPPPPPPGGGTPPPPPPPPPGGGTPPPPPPPPGGGTPPPGGGWGSAPPPPPGPGGPTGPGGYSVGNAFTYAFDKFKQNIGPLVLITLILLVSVFVIQFIGNVISSGMSGAGELTFNPNTGEFEGGGGGFFAGAMIVSLLFSAISWTVQLVIQAGIIKASLALTRGQRVDLGSAFNGINWGQVVVAALLIGVGTFVGLILCILPGIVWIFLTWFTLYFVIDRDMSAVDAIKASINLVKDNIGPLLLFALAALAAYIVGACLCGVGLLAAIPIVVIAQAYTFRTLTGDTVTQ